MIFLILCWVVYPGKQWIGNRLHLAFLFFITVLLVCWSNSPFPELGDKIVLDDYWKVAVFYVLLASSIRDERGLRQLLTAYFVALGLYMGHSMLEYLNGRIEWRMGVARMTGVDVTFGDPNTFAATLLHPLPYLVPFWRESAGRSSRWLLRGYLVLTLLCILFTGSRRALLGLMVYGVILICTSRYRWRLLLLAVLVAPAGFATMREDLQNRFLTLIDPSYGPHNAQGSAEFRTHAWVDGFRIWGERPFTGVGPGAFGEAAGHMTQAHNMYAQTMAELGTFGILALVLLVAAFLVNGREARRRCPPALRGTSFPYQVSRATVIAVILLLAMGAGGHNLYRYNWLWFGAFQAAALHCLRTRPAVAVATRRAWRPAARPGVRVRYGAA
jgi:O-antigen ligase